MICTCCRGVFDSVRHPPHPRRNALVPDRDRIRTTDAPGIDRSLEGDPPASGRPWHLINRRFIPCRPLLQRRHHLVYLLSLQIIHGECSYAHVTQVACCS